MLLKGLSLARTPSRPTGSRGRITESQRVTKGRVAASGGIVAANRAPGRDEDRACEGVDLVDVEAVLQGAQHGRLVQVSQLAPVGRTRLSWDGGNLATRTHGG